MLDKIRQYWQYLLIFIDLAVYCFENEVMLNSMRNNVYPSAKYAYYAANTKI